MATLLCSVASSQTPNAASDDVQGFEMHGSIGVDFGSQYFFRGIIQESRGSIVQPWVDVAIPFAKDGNTSWSFLTGVWNSLHNGPTGSRTHGQSSYYELDLYAGLGVEFAENWSSSLTYLVLSSPNNSFSSVEEIDLALAFDDSGLFSGSAGGFQGLQPSMTLAWELDGQSDGGSQEGVYLQTGIEPGFDFFAQGESAIHASFPLVTGFSLSNYYENAVGSDDFFGFAQGGLALSSPLSFISPGLSNWTIHADVSLLLLGENLQRINGGDDATVIVTLGIETSF